MNSLSASPRSSRVDSTSDLVGFQSPSASCASASLLISPKDVQDSMERIHRIRALFDDEIGRKYICPSSQDISKSHEAQISGTDATDGDLSTSNGESQQQETHSSMEPEAKGDSPSPSPPQEATTVAKSSLPGTHSEFHRKRKLEELSTTTNRPLASLHEPVSFGTTFPAAESQKHKRSLVPGNGDPMLSSGEREPQNMATPPADKSSPPTHAVLGMIPKHTTLLSPPHEHEIWKRRVPKDESSTKSSSQGKKTGSSSSSGGKRSRKRRLVTRPAPSPTSCAPYDCSVPSCSTVSKYILDGGALTSPKSPKPSPTKFSPFDSESGLQLRAINSRGRNVKIAKRSLFDSFPSYGASQASRGRMGHDYPMTGTTTATKVATSTHQS